MFVGLGDRRFDERVGEVSQRQARRTGRCVAAEQVDDQPEGAFHLAVGEGVRPGPPVGDDSQAALVGLAEGEEGGVDAGEMGGAVVGLSGEHPDQQRAHPQLAGTPPGWQRQFERGSDGGRVDDLLETLERHAQRAPPNNATASASPAGARPAVMSPRRWVQLTPAAARKVAIPSWSATAASQLERSRCVSRRPRSTPPASEEISGVVTLWRSGSTPPITHPSPAKSAEASTRSW